jgi:hypothetical protein
LDLSYWQLCQLGRFKRSLPPLNCERKNEATFLL